MKRAVKFLWITTFLGILGFAGLITATNYGLFGAMPSIDELQNPSSSLASELYADDGSMMGKYFLEDRSPVKFDDISKNIINALIATEDERFYKHSGIDAIALLRVVRTLGKQGGGSTITQQLALNMFGKDRASNKLQRAKQKLQEWIIAVKLEKNFTKEEILTYYLNTVPFGDNIFGIRNASRTFFQKEPDRVNVQEAAILVGMLKANTFYNPRINPKAALDRRNTVISQMVNNNFLTEQMGIDLKRKPIELNYRKTELNIGMAPYFRESVVKEEVKRLLKGMKNPKGKEYNIYKDGLRIYTTINPKMQSYAEDAVIKNISEQQRSMYGAEGNGGLRSGAIWNKHQEQLDKAMKMSDRWKDNKEAGMSDVDNRASFDKKVKMKVFTWLNSKRERDTTMSPIDSIKYQKQFLQSGFLSMEAKSGYIKAWVGGIDFKNFQLDHANLNTKRQVGSAMKPMLYCLALEEAGFTPDSEAPNVPQNFPGYGLVPALGKGARGGTFPLNVAIAKSLNGVAAYLIKQVTPRRYVEFLNTCRVQTKISPYPSIALGTCDLSLYELMWMYTMFPGRGFNIRPQFITRIEDKNGNVLVNVQPDVKEVVSEITAYLMCKMMTGCVINGTGKDFSKYGLSKLDIGAKTGTTNDNSDSWFMSYTPELLTGCWVGADDRFIKTPGEGAKVAMPAVGNYLKNVYADSKLGYDELAKFIKPAIDKNDIISDYVEGTISGGGGSRGGSSTVTEGTNGEADDYMSDEQYYEDTTSQVIEPIKQPDSKKDTPTKKESTPSTTIPKAVMPDKKKDTTKSNL